MNDADTTSKASSSSSLRGLILPIFAIVLSMVAVVLLIRQNSQQADIEQRLNGKFTGMDKRLSDLLESGALFPDKSIPAAEAVALAKKAIADGDKKLARIYYLSAINHAPSEFQILNDYANLVLADKDSTAEDTGQLKSVLQISLYQIPPNNIASALA